MKLILIVGAVVAAVFVGILFVRRRVSTQSPGATAALRSMALNLQPAEAGITVPATPAGVWGAVADIGLPGGSATIVALQDGTASMYLSGGGGVIGGQGHESVRKAAAALIAAVERSATAFPEHGPQALPQSGGVRLYAHSKLGLLASPELSQEALISGAHPLSPCFLALNDLLTQLRLVSGPGA